jgi:DNA anti-recombination protein RmuC
MAAAKEAFISINNFPSTNRGDWMRQVGVVDTQLTEMQATLNNLIAATPKKKKLRKVNQTLAEITKMQQEIQSLIQKAYGIN